MQEHIQMLLELISCDEKLFYWRYSGDGELLEKNDLEQSGLERIFEHFFLKKLQQEQLRDPLVLGDKSGITWIVVGEEGEKGEKGKKGIASFHVLGPFFILSLRPDYLEEILREISFADSAGSTSAANAWRQKLIKSIGQLPVLPAGLYRRYAAMLQYCASGRRVELCDICQRTEIPDQVGQEERDSGFFYQVERALLRMVQEGDERENPWLRGALSSMEFAYGGEEPLEWMKVSCATFSSLCARAAIEGGLPVAEAYATSDGYIKKVMAQESISNIADLRRQIHQDFIWRVRQRAGNDHYSKLTQSCCDYINFHLEEKLSIERIANHMGYAKYYLSRSFHQEVGMSINEYINLKKVERAKQLLSTTQNSVLEIAEELSFCSSSHFGDTFKKIAGQSPQQYRKENQVNW